jgi:hypothetical protein
MTSRTSKAHEQFAAAIKDAERMLEHFEAANAIGKSQQDSEVLKRAGLVMALTAWETYVEERLREGVRDRLERCDSKFASRIIERVLERDLGQLHNPTPAKVKDLFHLYLSIPDLPADWKWAGFDPDSARTRLDELLKKRGDVVHRASVPSEAPEPHRVRKADLAKAITFLKHLVAATDDAVARALAQT